MSSYIVLARKLRPQTFKEVVGQDYIVKALRNAAISGKLAHALLFTGPRGVGKTSTARIVAKTVNCENSSPEQRPCGEDVCESCSLITEGRAIEVQEMDAASHTSVNDVRDIIEKSRYIPASGKKKIYIIDEAHMLSQAAFNALLKTLEEPPGHVVFILATTEPHKIPATILSRCQRYDFRKVAVSEISAALEAAAKNEGINIAPETVSTIALEADGSMRDALSLMDQLTATFGTDIRHSEALELLGFVDTDLMNTVFEAITGRDSAKGLKALKNALDKGTEPKKFAETLTSLLRTAVILKISGENSVPDISKEREQFLLSAAENNSPQDLEMLFDIALEECDRTARSFYPEMATEAMLMKLCSVEKAVPLDDIMRRLKKMTNGETGAGGETSGGGRKPEKKEASYSNPPAEKKTEIKEQTLQENGNAAEQMETSGNAERFSRFLKSSEKDFGYISSLVSSCEIKVENSLATIKVQKPSVMQEKLGKKEDRENFLSAAEEFFGCKAEIGFCGISEIKTPDAAAGARLNGNKPAGDTKKIEEHPIVKQVVEMFDGKIKKLRKGEKNEI